MPDDKLERQARLQTEDGADRNYTPVHGVQIIVAADTREGKLEQYPVIVAELNAIRMTYANREWVRSMVTGATNRMNKKLGIPKLWQLLSIGAAVILSTATIVWKAHDEVSRIESRAMALEIKSDFFKGMLDTQQAILNALLKKP
jgi:hypothetical protein